jgi:dTMP kinase
MLASYFIVLEGLDGCGKTTMAKRIHQWLTDNGVSCIHTREIGGTPFAEQIRNTLLSMADIDYKLDETCQAMIASAARRDHMQRVIEPALYEHNKTVICERFYFSTIVYQGEADQIDTLLKLGHKDIFIDLVIYLKTNYDTVVKRIGDSRRDAMDVIDVKQFNRKQEVLQRALSHYELDNPGSLVTVDANQDEDTVFKSICYAISEMLMIDQLN